MTNDLLEKQGVPNGIILMSQSIARDILTILKNNNERTISDIKKYYINSFDILDKNNNCLKCKFTFDNIYGIDNDISNNSIIKLTLYKNNFNYDNYEDQFSDKMIHDENLYIKKYSPPKNIFTANSEYDIINNEIKIIINISIDYDYFCLMEHYEHYKQLLIDIITHELIHCVKNLIYDLHTDENFIKFYNELLLIKDNSSPYISNVAYLFYMTSIIDERNSYVGQFYSEIFNKKIRYSQTTLYKDIKRGIECLEKISDNDNIKYILFKKFYNISKYFFHINTKNVNEWYDKFSNKLKYNTNITLKKMSKTLTLNEDCYRIYKITNKRY